MPVLVEIISPERVLFSREVEMAVLPGTEGDIAAMPQHAPTMLQLRGGVVAIHDSGKVRERYFVAGGFADIRPDRCTILADAARSVDELSVEDARARLEAAESAASGTDINDVTATELAQERLQIARAEVEVAEEG